MKHYLDRQFIFLFERFIDVLQLEILFDIWNILTIRTIIKSVT